MTQVAEMFEMLGRAKQQREASPIHFYIPNEGAQVSFHRSPAQTRIILGGNSSGKSYAALGAEVAYHTIPEFDDESNETGYAIHPHRRIRLPNVGLISSPTEEVQRGAKGGTQAYVRDFLKSNITNIVQERGVWKFVDHKYGVIEFKTWKSGREAYQSETFDWAALDEPHPQAVWNEIAARLIRTTPEGSRWIAMTPIVDPEKAISIEIVLWMIDKVIKPILKKKRAGLDLDGYDAWVMNINENRKHVNVEAAKRLFSTMGEEERHIRLTGEFITEITGAGGFDSIQLNTIENGCIEPKVGTLVHSGGRIRFDEGIDNDVRRGYGHVVRIVHFPVKGHKYILSIDVGGTTDPSSCTIFNITRKEVAAELHGWVDETELHQLVFNLGVYYNLAYIIIETNKEGMVTSYLLQKGNPALSIPPYPNLYRRRNSGGNPYSRNRNSYEVGWKTTSGNRELLIGNVRMFIAHCMRVLRRSPFSPLPLSDYIEEMRTFKSNNRGKLEAIRGYNDDRIMSLGMAIEAAKKEAGKDFLEEPALEEKKDIFSWDKEKGIPVLNIEEMINSTAEREMRKLYHIE